MSQLQRIEEKLNKLLVEKAEEGVWFPERQGEAYVGIPWETLRKMRNDPKHIEGWRYMPSMGGSQLSKRGYTIRRKVQWNLNYLNGLFRQVA